MTVPNGKVLLEMFFLKPLDSNMTYFVKDLFIISTKDSRKK